MGGGSWEDYGIDKGRKFDLRTSELRHVGNILFTLINAPVNIRI